MKDLLTLVGAIVVILGVLLGLREWDAAQLKGPRVYSHDSTYGAARR